MPSSQDPQRGHTAQRSPFLLALTTTGMLLVIAGLALIARVLVVPVGIALSFGGATLISIALQRWLTLRSEKRPAQRKLKHSTLIAAVALTAMLLPCFMLGLDSVEPAHGDELFWMPASQQSFRLFFIEGRYTDPFWSNFNNLFLAYHPPIAKYMIGAALWAADIPPIAFQGIDWTKSVAWNLEHGFKLAPGALLVARIPSALTAVIAGLAVFWIGVMLDSWGLGLLAGMCFVSSPIVLTLGRQAMLDMPTLCLSLLTVTSVLKLLQTQREGRIALHWAAIAGIFNGLAIGSKLIALVLSGTVCWLLLYETERSYQLEKSLNRYLIVCMLTIGFWTGLVFYGLNPLLYTHPLHGIQKMVSFVSVVQQTSYYPTHSLSERLLTLWQALDAPGTLGRFGLPGGHVLALTGAILMVRMLMQLKAPTTHIAYSFLLWSAVVFLLLLATLPADVNRYLLPLQPIAALLQAYAILVVLRMCGRVIRARLQMRSF